MGLISALGNVITILIIFWGVHRDLVWLFHTVATQQVPRNVTISFHGYFGFT